ncbi:sugar phosphate isomerase/epimerase [Haloferax sp. Atlit-4N]|uniref:sugar phosphate isomerase/epimerase family protein n=1 Tax=Haloferax sp. Atlit-4N TaxID=2077206 RepID=UPI000E21D120|nr:TIM barrel protein [Haloferax sp. Atlit-4N]RDZ51370.1 sugar phosphate isomerase/epimerase [Haloferax sp. Atlit-4N]
MEIGVCTISSKSHSIESVLEICHDLSVDGVEIWGKDHIPDRSQQTCQAIAAAGSRWEVTIPVYGSYLRVGGEDFDQKMETELDVTEWLGADKIRVWAGNREYAECDEMYWNQVVSDLEQLARAAQQRGLSVTVERHAGTVTDRTEGAKALIEAVDSPVIGLNWQPLFEHDPDTIATDATRLAPLTNNVHLQAMSAPDEQKRCQLSDAYFNVPNVIEIFDDIGYDGFLEIEFVTQSAPYEVALAADVAYLKALL